MIYLDLDPPENKGNQDISRYIKIEKREKMAEAPSEERQRQRHGKPVGQNPEGLLGGGPQAHPDERDLQHDNQDEDAPSVE